MMKQVIFDDSAFGKAAILGTKYIRICLLLAFFVFFWANPKILAIPTIDIVGPAGSQFFGSTVVVLPNGNIVIVDYLFNQGAVTNVGAVYLYNGTTFSLISVLKGSTAGDRVGRDGIHVLPNGNFVVGSRSWDNGSITNAGAITLCNATTGCNGTVSPANSLVGGTIDDEIGFHPSNPQLGIFKLVNSNYVISSPGWDNGSIVNAGAVTWCSGTTPTVGLVSSANSLVGGTANDQIGGSLQNDRIFALSNGNYVVTSPGWNNGAITDAGAVTWGNGNGGTVGLISSANSLVGGSASDSVGSIGVVALANGNYVAIKDSQGGAVTWGNGLGGTTGLVSSANSLVGGTSGDRVGTTDDIFSTPPFCGVTPLPNGNYVVRSPWWTKPNPDGFLLRFVGAVTLGNGLGGTVGVVTSANSLIGESFSDWLGSGGVTVMTNGDYVVSSPSWDNVAFGSVDAGAVTRKNAVGGGGGMVSHTNSLVGGSSYARVGSGGVTALSNGSYVVLSPEWNSAFPSNAGGAATWCNLTGSPVGPVSAANSLVGSNHGDLVDARVYALPNSNYVLASPKLDTPLSPQISDIGAVIWGSGTGGTTGLISAFNSLLGISTGDQVGADLTVLTNSNYVVCSSQWNNGTITDAGAATWNNGTGGIIGAVTSTNSLVGGSNDDRICNRGVTALTNGNYVVASKDWDDPSSFANVGAATWGNGTTGSVGLVTRTNSLIGGTENDYLTSIGDFPEGHVYRSVLALPNGNFTFMSRFWSNPVGPIPGVSAVTIGNGNGHAGLLSSTNSIFGPSTGSTSDYLYDSTNNRVIIRRLALSRVSVQVSNLSRTPFDYDSDGKTDISVYRPSNGIWYLNRSQAGFFGINFGNSTDRIVPADYDGDGKTDVAVYRPSEGIWYIVNSSNGTNSSFRFGLNGDLPAPADYDGDGKADLCVFRPSDGTWYRQNSGNGTFFAVQFGSNGDKPTIGDFDGDGRADIAVFRPSNGAWYQIRSLNGAIFAEQFGFATDVIVPADYDGDGKTDLAVYRASEGIWYVKASATSAYLSHRFGLPPDIPAPGDFDGDGKADLSIFRPSEGNWYRQNSSNGTFNTFPFGVNGDRPTQSAFQ